MSRAIARSSLIHMLPGHLQQMGIDAASIFRQAGMGRDHMVSPLIVRRAQIHAALGLAARAVGQAEIALSLGAAAQPPKLGPPGLAIVTGQSLEACLRRHIAVMPRLQDNCEQRLWVDGGSAIFSHRLVGDDQSAWLLYEGAAAFMVQSIRQILGANWAPELITFPHACRGRRATYEAHFGGPVVFGIHAEARIYFPKALLGATRNSYPTGSTAPSLAELMPIGQFCLLEMERFDYDAQRLFEALFPMIEASLPYTALTIANASARLGLSPRTLQRRLAESGWTFESLVDHQRLMLARQRLADLTQSITDVAMSLGYSDAAHFNRAFRRWENCSPSEYRQKLQDTAKHDITR